MTSVTNALKARISTRAYQDKPVPKEVIEEILEVASRAPSGGNTQPWHLYVLTGDAREELVRTMRDPKVFKKNKQEYAVYPSKATEPRKFSERKRAVAFDMYDLMGVDRNDNAGRAQAMAKNWEFFGAPVGILVSVDRACDRNAWGHTGMLLQSICLLAEERGLATCLQEAWGNLDAVPEFLKLPESEVLWCAIALGYPDKDAPVNKIQTTREPLDQFVRWHGFDSLPSSKL
mmetsp:Transcript_39123/g.59074  ORF Transcript_39123/g.59074 Transcript_39123/m.59074 type:complete len:232 (-) Transcript_39123:308-1003(-)|eukprot:CAMPEP_0194759770 /NCGR_PEP_ID=MMETSP0323_2-20130528/12778_1 /TAXON_ID=2866 ORGANISM="Crypthecodinium cohnii, Strain Seligo" /NCGR_SAMPLE_ID=MMETSP0323_2 /ASSEMBLY_ACC=CAM_ASM_000346 /LENGTH=231 /DNA_ID=CAMNT_0039680687 /DNA_START=91 /DNA_END=786 /DNA_ORIENTATION=-